MKNVHKHASRFVSFIYIVYILYIACYIRKKYSFFRVSLKLTVHIISFVLYRFINFSGIDQ